MHVLLALLLLAGCASTPKKSPPATAAPAPGKTAKGAIPGEGEEEPEFPDPQGDCRKFCDIIKTCATRAKHPKLASLLCRIARCETGGKCTGMLDSKRQLYMGPFQYNEVTWRERCLPLFERKQLDECAGDDAIYDVCCATICAADMIGKGGIAQWPRCGKRAKKKAQPIEPKM
jgi:hypothetical protein